MSRITAYVIELMCTIVHSVLRSGVTAVVFWPIIIVVVIIIVISGNNNNNDDDSSSSYSYSNLNFCG